MILKDQHVYHQEVLRQEPSRDSSFGRYYAPAFLAVCGLAFVLRIWNLGAASLWYDEAMYGWLARGFQPGLLSGRIMLVEPLFVWPLSWWVQWSHEDWWLRLPSVIAGVLTVYVGASTVRIVAGRRASLYAALILAVAPVLIYYSRDAKMYAWVFLWQICTIRSAVGVATSPDRLWPLLGYVVAGTALCYTHFAAPLYLAVSGLGFLICFARTFRMLLRWSLANLLIVVLSIPFIIAELRYQSIMRSLSFHAHPPDFRSLGIAFAHCFTAYTTCDMLLLAAPLFFGVLILIGLIRARATRAPMAFLMLFGTVPMLMLFVLSSLAPWSLFIDRYILASSIPLLLAASITLGLTKTRIARVVGLILCVILSGLALQDVYRHTLPKDIRQRRGLIARPDAGRMADILRSKAAPETLVLHPSWETEPTLRWYAPEFHHVLTDYQGQMRMTLDNIATRDYQAFYGWEPVDVRNVATSVTSAWLVLPTANDILGSQHSGVIEELARRGKLVFSESCGAAILQCYDLAAGKAGSGWLRESACITFPQSLGGNSLEFHLNSSDQEESADFELSVNNRTDQNVFFQFEAVSCDVALPGSALTSRLNAKSAWSHETYLAAGAYRTATTFRVHPKASPGDDLAACLKMPPGEYSIYLERTTEGSVYTIPAASLCIKITDGHTDTFSSIGNDSAGRGGWVWEYLGATRLSGELAGLVVSATDPRQRPEAYAVFSQFVFVKTEQVPVTASQPHVLRDSVQCPPGSITAKTLSILNDANCLTVQGRVMDACVSLINTRTNDAILSSYSDCMTP